MSEDPLASASPSITKHIDDTIFARKYRVAELVRAIEKMDEIDDNELASEEEVKELEDLEKKIRDHEGIFKEELSTLEDAKSKDIWFMATVLPLPIFGMFILDFNLFQYENIPVCLHILYSGPVITLVYVIASLIYFIASRKRANSKELGKPTEPDALDDWEHTITAADLRHRQLEILKYFKKLRCGIVAHKIWIYIWVKLLRLRSTDLSHHVALIQHPKANRGRTGT
ncbi:hypothetical protein CAEBREN_11983 [Caenorhabditis brenneri]|uniref:Uncharacterized protein n=1 Tax=Caenorhabditis brenneri TaxID=135651 RepID=G0MBX1_CAEBE|nr:hypothetical protein CAEBREN_11983 [Caenorhabditis brenneri]